ncbi:MAG: Trx7/PDZ domain-containing (seleno)protein [Gemmataceae bacterium]
MCRAVLFHLALLAGLAPAQNREEKVRADRQKVEAEGFWIYNDLPRGFAEAKRANKPMLVALRCIPCEECVKLDDDLVNQDKRVRPLLEKFVRVRVVSTNGLDLSLFQFDHDQSFAAFLLNADGAIYGRFGTRSHRTSWSDDVSIEGLAKALQRALELHADYPRNKEELALKKGPKPDVATPEKYPLLSGKYGPTLNYAGKVVPSCIHCHQIGDAQRDTYRARGEPIPEGTLFPYPHPKAVGLVLDPKECATVMRVEKGSPAEKAGFEAGDVVTRLGGQTPLSIADVQWVLHRTPAAGGTLPAEVRRGGAAKALTLSLPRGWRRADDISWRVSTWGLRRMALGGLVLESDKGGLRVRHVGQYGLHAAAKNAGFRKGDLVVSFDGRDDLRRESDLPRRAERAPAWRQGRGAPRRRWLSA